MERNFWHNHAVWLFGIGYMGFYIPYSAMTKALSEGLIPGVQQTVSGLQMLPAMSLGALLIMPVFLLTTGLWRHAGRARLPGGFTVLFPQRWTALSAFATAVIIGATTMNYTFAGLSIVFVLLLMRGGVLILSPLIDKIRLRPVNKYSWVALVLSLIAIVIALTSVESYTLGLPIIICLAAYLSGYLVRFLIMSKHAKTGHAEIDRTYFVEEHMAAIPFLVIILLILAITMPGQIGVELRYGFTDFFSTRAVIPALIIGVLYESLFIFGSLIYLNPREYTFCVPINRAASLIAGVIASYLLAYLFGMPPPQKLMLISVVIMMVAMTVLAFGSKIVASLKRKSKGHKQMMLVFVCAKNIARSPMAQALCAREIASRLGLSVNRLEQNGVVIVSAGISPEQGKPMRAEVSATLRQVGIAPPTHNSRSLNVDLIEQADVVFCMTEAHRLAAVSIMPEATDRIFCLHPEKDISNPKSGDPNAYLKCVRQLNQAFALRLPHLGFN